MKRFEVLAQLVRDCEFIRGAEIGVQGGVTLRHLLRECPGLHMIAVDAWEERPDHRAGDTYVGWQHEGNEAKVRAIAAETGRAEVIKGLSSVVACQVADKSLDFVFIDAAHDVWSTWRDVQAWWPKVRRLGLICGHDHNWPSVAYVVDHLFPRRALHDDNVWTAPKEWIVKWTPDEATAAAKDRETYELYQDGHLSESRRRLLERSRDEAAEHDGEAPPAA